MGQSKTFVRRRTVILCIGVLAAGVGTIPLARGAEPEAPSRQEIRATMGEIFASIQELLPIADRRHVVVLHLKNPHARRFRGPRPTGSLLPPAKQRHRPSARIYM